MITEPQLAVDWKPSKVKFPVYYQPKIDGVRGLNLFGTMTARTLRPHNNKFLTRFFSHELFRGFDGELAAESETHPLLCHLTTSATSTIEGAPWILWHVFDYLTPETEALAYERRYQLLIQRVLNVKAANEMVGCHLKPVPSVLCSNMEELEMLLNKSALDGYEGGILRGPDVPHKNGRSSVLHRGLLRCKTFIEVDAVITDIMEGKRNENEATLNRLGRTERSTVSENMVPNGMVGTVVAQLCEDAVHPLTGVVVHRKGDFVKFSAGRMPHFERDLYFREPWRIMGARMKGQIFPHGVKDKARFPTFQSLRSAADTIAK